MIELAVRGVAAFGFLYALMMAVGVWRVMRGVPRLADLSAPPPPRWPRVSVIIPACNEGDTIEAALRSRLDEGYPCAEYLVVDDRSDDDTGKIIDALALEDQRIVAMHVETLPPDWLGKVHAMHGAAARATGEWLLFSDADVHHRPGTLTRVIAHCEERAIDHIVVFPEIWPARSGVDVLLSTAIRMFAVMSRAWKVSDPSSPVSIGAGVFNLVRRSAFDRAGGFEPLKLEIIDDVALGQALKWSGARQAVVNASGFVGLSFYRSVKEVIVGAEKNGFAAMGRFSVARAAFGAAILSLGELGGAGSLVLGDTIARGIGGAALVLLVASQIAVGCWLGRPALPSLFAPVGSLLFIFGVVRSVILALVRGGVDWRGTRYPLDALRRGMRYVVK